MRNYGVFSDTIRDRVSARDAAVALGIRVNRSGRCQCPIHHGQDYNMVVYADNRGFFCHTCKQGGDCIRLVERVNQCSFPEAVEWLNSTFKLGLPLDREQSTQERKDAEIAKKQRQIERELKQAILDELFETYLNAGDVVMRLERDKEDFRPRTAFDEWDERFVTALRLLTEAKELAVEAGIEAIGIRQ